MSARRIDVERDARWAAVRRDAEVTRREHKRVADGRGARSVRWAMRMAQVAASWLA